MLNATLIEKHEFTPDLISFKVKPDSGIPAFKAGQYVAIGLPEVGDGASDKVKILKRAYSIASSPVEKDTIEFFIAIVKDGALTPRLKELKLGEKLFVAPKVTGHFTLEDVPDDKNLILVSTGTGLAPYLSMIREEKNWSQGRKITILHGVRVEDDLGYREELERYAQMKNLTYLPYVTRQDPTLPSVRKGRVTHAFTDGVITCDPERDHIFLCGNPAMIEELESHLVNEKRYIVHSKKTPGSLHVEKYW